MNDEVAGVDTDIPKKLCGFNVCKSSETQAKGPLTFFAECLSAIEASDLSAGTAQNCSKQFRKPRVNGLFAENVAVTDTVLCCPYQPSLPQGAKMLRQG